MAYTRELEPDLGALTATDTYKLEDAVQAPAQARRNTREALGSRLGHQQLADVLVVVSELVTNALKHGGGSSVLTVARHHRGVTITVTDRFDGAESITQWAQSITPDQRTADDHLLQVGGRGLALTNTLATQWTARSNEEGTAVTAVFIGTDYQPR